MEIWTLRPNWRSRYRVTYNFLTEVIVSRSGREQRRALRQTPRKTIEFLVTAFDERWPAFVRQFNLLQGDLIYLPEVTDAAVLTAAVAATVTEFPVDRVPGWAIAGAKAILVFEDGVELREIEGVGEGTITFTEGSGSAWPRDAKIAPALAGRLRPKQAIQQIVPSLADAVISFAVDPGTELPRDVGEPEIEFNGREVFVESADWSSPRDLTFQRDVATVDYSFGRIRSTRPTYFTTHIRGADYLAGTSAQARRLLAFFERHRGRQGEFYIATDSADIQASEVAGATITVIGEDFANAYRDDKSLKAISIRLIGGERLFREVLDLDNGGGLSTITLDAALTGVTAADIDLISWMPVMRGASDQLQIEWITDCVAEARFTFQSLEDLPAE